VADDDSYTVAEDNVLTVAAPGVLGNDTDSDGDALTALLVSDVSNGSLTLNTDGSFTYTPTPGFSGSDSFTYVANDGTADSAVAATVHGWGIEFGHAQCGLADTERESETDRGRCQRPVPNCHDA
jgi:VCBS repeat-containing protein